MDLEEIPIAGKVLSKNIEPLSLKKGIGGSGLEEIPIVNPLKKYEKEETPYMAQHPNLYALKETAKDLPMDVLKAVVPYTKYLDPEERKRFMGLEGVEGGSFWEPKTKVQAQVRELLKENLFSELLVLPGSKGFKYGMEKASGYIAKKFPKFTKVMTKPRMLSQLQKEEATIELANQTPLVQKLNKVLREAKPIRAEQEKMYTATRKYRMSEVEKVTTGGEAGYYERIGKLKGEMPKVQFESIRKPPEVAKAKGKEAWEMTREEFESNVWYQGRRKESRPTGWYTKFADRAKIFSETRSIEKSGESVIDIHYQKNMPDEIFINPKTDMQMPKKEYRKYFTDLGDSEKKSISVETIPSSKAENAHKYLTQKALSEGKPVPESVLKDYPDLKPPVESVIKKQFDQTSKLIGQQDIDALFTQLQGSQRLNEWEKLTAGRGLAKIFGEFGGHVPQERELEFLTKEFGTTFTKTILSKQSLFTKMKDAGFNLANIPRSIMASFDLSAPLRQGLFFTTKPKQFFSAFKSMFKPFASEKSYQNLIGEITSRPTYSLMEESGLSITGLGKGLTNREEVFMSNWAEKIPLIGRGVRASERAYVGFLNRLRADVFDDFVKKGAKLGIENKKYFTDAARFVNTATGRGGLGPLEPSAVALNTAFFSPRLMMSRLNLLNPGFYAGLEPTVRKEALKSLFLFGSGAMGVAGLLKLGGAEVGFDPRSADFMKAKFGNTRYDFLGGFQQPIRAAAQILSGKVISSTTGKTMTLGEGYRPLTRTEIAARFLEYKEAPVVSFAHSLIRGSTALGEKFDVPTEVANRFVPMIISDIKDMYDEKGFEGIPMASPAIFGVGVQTYGGVQSYGLNGKDYPVLQKELLRLKTSMGYPSTVAFGESLSNKEYKILKQKAGVDVANDLSKLINTEFYQGLSDKMKVNIIEDRIDIIKDKVKLKMFPTKMKKSILKSAYRSGGDDDETADKKADELLKRKNK